MFEHRSESLLSHRHFIRRMGRQLGLGAILIACSLALGTAGYHVFNHSDWIDGFVDASMLMAGMGEVNGLSTTAGKLFAAFYALYCGVVFILVAGLLLAPIFHRVLHRFHLDETPAERRGRDESHKPGPGAKPQKQEARPSTGDGRASDRSTEPPA